MRSGFGARRIHILILVLVSIIVYSNTIGSGFVYDDIDVIQKNPLVQSLKYYAHPSAVEGGGFRNSLVIGFKTRFVSFLSFALNYRLDGERVRGYHIVNLFIHASCAVLVYLLLLGFVRLAGCEGGNIPLSVALIFACHPVATSAVAYIAQRYTSLGAFFYLLAMTLYVRFRMSAQGDRQRGLFYVCALVAAALGAESKEFLFTLPFAILLFEFVFMRLQRKWLPSIPFFIIMASIPLMLVMLHGKVADLEDIGAATRIASAPDISRWEYLMSQPRVMLTYFRLMVLPVNLTLDYDYPVMKSLTAFGVIVPLIALLGLIGSAGYMLRRAHMREGEDAARMRLASFGILWFFITISVESSIVPLKDVINEYRMYLPSMGLVLALVSILRIDMKRAMLALLVIVMATGAYARNLAWSDEMTLWQDVVLKAPHKSRGHENIARLFQRQERHDEAISHLRLIVGDDPQNYTGWYNLGRAYKLKGDYQASIESYEESIRLKPGFVWAINNIGSIYLIVGDIDRAFERFSELVKYQPEFGAAHYNLGLVYLRKAMQNEALQCFEAARDREPSADAYYQIARILRARGQTEEAIRNYMISIRMNPKSAQAYAELGDLYRAIGDSAKADLYYRASEELRK